MLVVTYPTCVTVMHGTSCGPFDGILFDAVLVSRPRSGRLRALTADEHHQMVRLGSDAATRGVAQHAAARARALLAVHGGATYAAAARVVGRQCASAVSRLVLRFNRDGLPAIMPRHGGGRCLTYAACDRAYILDEVHRLIADPGPRRWSVASVQRALRDAPDPRLHRVSHPVIRQVLRGAGLHWTHALGWHAPPGPLRPASHPPGTARRAVPRSEHAC